MILEATLCSKDDLYPDFSCSTFFIALLDFFVSRTLRSCLRTNTATSTCRTSPTPSTTPWIRTQTRKKNCKCRLCVWRIFYICYFCIARHFYQIWRIFCSAPLFSRLFVHPFIKWWIYSVLLSN